MAKKTAELSAELREAIFEAARAGALEAYAANTGDFVNYFKATETLLYNYKKLAALVADEEAYTDEKGRSAIKDGGRKIRRPSCFVLQGADRAGSRSRNEDH